MAKKNEPIKYERTLEEAVSEAFSELEGLAQEMREAFDNTPESLQNSGAGEARGVAADTLEEISEAEVPEELKSLKVSWALFPKKNKSRAARRDDAVTILDECIQMLADLEDEAQKEAAEGFVDELENAKDTAESVEFPGMYG
jgi:hypothetical protein